jgi:hypothetical protein
LAGEGNPVRVQRLHGGEVLLTHAHDDDGHRQAGGADYRPEKEGAPAFRNISAAPFQILIRTVLLDPDPSCYNFLLN